MLGAPRGVPDESPNWDLSSLLGDWGGGGGLINLQFRGSGGVEVLETWTWPLPLHLHLHPLHRHRLSTPPSYGCAASISPTAQGFFYEERSHLWRNHHLLPGAPVITTDRRKERKTEDVAPLSSLVSP